MSYYAFIYGTSMVLSIVCWWLVFKQYRNLSGLFFFLFTFFASLWFLFYFLFFSGIENTTLLLFLSRFNFGNGVATTLSLALFIYFFDAKKGKIWSQRILWFLALYISIYLLHAGTDIIIAGLTYSWTEHVYREIPWKGYFLHVLLQLSNIFLFCWMSIVQLKRQVYLNKIRLKRILLSAFLFIVTCLVLQLLLPIFWIWILEKEIVFFFVFLVFYIFLTVKRYYFSSIWYGVGKLAVTIGSAIFSVCVLNIFKYIWDLHIKAGGITNYWLLEDKYYIISTIVVVMAFVHTQRVLHSVFLGETAISRLKKNMDRLEKEVVHFTNLHNLESYLQTEMKRIFKINFSEICLYMESSVESEIQRYFKNNLIDKIFINDVVFMEEKKNKFNREALFKELPEETFLVLPIFDTDGETHIGKLILGAKSFGDFYTVEEIDILREFVSFLEVHLKYMRTYVLLEKLSENLDKKVDEKTMQYNELLSRQKEFISIISHEIKAPIANAIFQIDGMIDDMQEKTYTKEWLLSEITSLNNQLIRTGELTSRLFSMQHFESQKVRLIREMVHIGEFLQSEMDVYARVHDDMEFVCDIDDSVKFVHIDKIQFQQVISNLLQNAVKFSKNQTIGKVHLHAHVDNKTLFVSIDDNGQGFKWVDMETIFKQYTTGGGLSIWLGLGLYLCKNIVELHGGVIYASISSLLGGARFSIEIPSM